MPCARTGSRLATPSAIALRPEASRVTSGTDIAGAPCAVGTTGDTSGLVAMAGEPEDVFPPK